MDEQNPIPSRYLTPLAILVAGVLIAFSVYYSRGSRDSIIPPLEDAKGPAASLGENAATILALKDADYFLGSPGAEITIVEYGDYQCPFCGKFYNATEQELKEKYVKTGKAKFIWRDFAFLGEESLWAAEAARCAGEQGKFWQYHDYLFENQKGENRGAFSKDNLKKFAKNLGLDSGKFDECLESEKYREAVQNQTQEGKSIGVDGTPTTFVNGEVIVGAQPFSVFQTLLETGTPKD